MPAGLSSFLYVLNLRKNIVILLLKSKTFSLFYLKLTKYWVQVQSHFLCHWPVSSVKIYNATMIGSQVKHSDGTVITNSKGYSPKLKENVITFQLHLGLYQMWNSLDVKDFFFFVYKKASLSWDFCFFPLISLQYKNCAVRK